MNREPALPSSTATSRRPGTTTIILRLRLPERGSTPSSGGTPPFESALGVVDADGVLPHSPATTAGATADPVVSAGIGDVEVVSAGANGVEGSIAPDGMWADLFLPDLVRQVASCLRCSRRDFERMRAVCSAWREAIPSTIDPFLVLSRKNPEVNSEVILMKIKRDNQPENASFEIKLPLSPPPTGVCCWGSAQGLMALQCCSPNSRQILVYCVQCGGSKEMLPLPMGLAPKALYLEPLTPLRFVLLAGELNADGTLHLDSDGFPWPMEGGPWWLEAPGFANIPLRTMALDPGVLRAGADRESIIIIDESGRPMDDEAQIMQIQLPPLLLSDGSSTSPWEINGQHLFLCNGKMYLVQIFDAPQAPQHVAVRLLGVEKVGAEEYTVTPVHTIGKYSVYLGPNQSFVLPSIDALVGRMANTIYVEDYRGSIRRPQALAINFHTMSTVVIPFPNEVACTLEDMLPAVWVGLPQQHDLFNHCRDDNCWRFWD